MKPNEKAPTTHDGRDFESANRAGLLRNSIENSPPREKLTLLFSINGRTLCQAEYRLAADTRFLEIPLPISRMLSAS